MKIEELAPLQSYNTFGIASTAQYLAKVQSLDDIKYVLDFAKNKKLPHWVLGGGSNLLFVKSLQPGICIKNELRGKQLIQEDKEQIIYEAAAGEPWHEWVEFCVNNNWGGLENLSLIPGLVGASPMQNIGAYGVELKDIFHSLEAYHFPTGEIHSFKKEDCAFGYRESVFKRKFTGEYLILSVRFQLSKHPVLNIKYGAIEQTLDEMDITNPTIQDVSKAVIKIRSEKLPNPSIIGNAGSFFKNPIIHKSYVEELRKEYQEIPFFKTEEADFIKIPAAWLIEKAGWKGYRNKEVGCHEKQPLVLVNFGHAKGQEVYDLAQEIISSIRKKFQIDLEAEVNIR